MAKLTFDGVEITKVTLDGIVVDDINFDGTAIYSSNIADSNIHLNTELVGGTTTTAPTSFTISHAFTCVRTDLGGGVWTWEFNDGAAPVEGNIHVNTAQDGVTTTTKPTDFIAVWNDTWSLSTTDGITAVTFNPAAGDETNIHLNTDMDGGSTTTRPTDFTSVWPFTAVVTDLGGGAYSYKFNEAAGTVQDGFEYRIGTGGGSNLHGDLVNGETYRYEVDITQHVVSNGVMGIDCTRGGLSNITLGTATGTLTTGVKVTMTQEFTVDDTSYLLRIRHGVGLGGASTGSCTIENPKLIAVGVGGGGGATNIHTNSNMTGGSDTYRPDGHVSVWGFTCTRATVDGSQSWEFNVAEGSVQDGFEYVMDSSTGSHQDLVNGRTYRFEADITQKVASDGVMGMDLTRGGLSGATLGTATGTLVTDTKVTMTQEFTITNASYLIRARLGVGLGGAATGRCIIENCKLIDTEGGGGAPGTIQAGYEYVIEHDSGDHQSLVETQVYRYEADVTQHYASDGVMGIDLTRGGLTGATLGTLNGTLVTGQKVTMSQTITIDDDTSYLIRVRHGVGLGGTATGSCTIENCKLIDETAETAGTSVQDSFEYEIKDDGQHSDLIVGNTYRYEADVTQHEPSDGVMGFDMTAGLVGATLGQKLGTLVTGQKVTMSQEFTIDNATYTVLVRHGVGILGTATGSCTTENHKLIDVTDGDTPAPPGADYTHTILVWHGANSAGMDASVPGGTIVPTAVAAGEGDVTRLTSIDSGQAILHILGLQDVGSEVTVVFDGGLSFTATGINYQDTHTRFIGSTDGTAIYEYFNANQGYEVQCEIFFTKFVPEFEKTHTLTPYDGTTVAGYDDGVGGTLVPIAGPVYHDDIIHLTSTDGGSPRLETLADTGIGDHFVVLLDDGNLSFSGIGIASGSDTSYTGSADLNNAIFDYLVANDGVPVDVQVIWTPLSVPSPNIHELPSVNYGAQSGQLLHVDHTSDGDDAVYDGTEFKARYDQDWASNQSCEIVDGRMKTTVPAGEYKHGIQSGGNLATDYDELFMSYEFEFGNGFDFVMGGKMPGLSGRPGMTGSHADGCNPQGTNGGFSCRMMFRSDGRLQGYFYHQDQPGQCGHEVYFYDGPDVFKVRNGTTYLMEIRVKMNSAGNHDGIVECKINGVQVLRKANFSFSADGSHGINHKFIQLWHGGNSSSWAPSQDSPFYINNLTISTSPLSY